MNGIVSVHYLEKNKDGGIIMTNDSSFFEAVRVSKEMFKEFDHLSKGFVGVYLLLIGKSSVYVGETHDDLFARIPAKHTGMIDKDWHTVVFFRTAKTKVSENELRYIENWMCEFFKNSFVVQRKEREEDSPEKDSPEKDNSQKGGSVLTKNPSKTTAKKRDTDNHYGVSDARRITLQKCIEEIKNYIEFFPGSLFPQNVVPPVSSAAASSEVVPVSSAASSSAVVPVSSAASSSAVAVAAVEDTTTFKIFYCTTIQSRTSRGEPNYLGKAFIAIDNGDVSSCLLLESSKVSPYVKTDQVRKIREVHSESLQGNEVKKRIDFGKNWKTAIMFVTGTNTPYPVWNDGTDMKGRSLTEYLKKKRVDVQDSANMKGTEPGENSKGESDDEQDSASMKGTELAENSEGGGGNEHSQSEDEETAAAVPSP